MIEIQPLMEQAEQAAHRGDFAAAETALRRVVELQELTLGPLRPELANTLNNLGIVYERLDRPADAESCYRKSFAIARAAFAPGHPLVETSTTNLREFCDARGIPFEQPEPAPASARVEPPIAVTPSPTRRETSLEAVAAKSSELSRPVVLGAIILVAVAAALLFSSRRTTSPEPAPPVVAVAPPPSPERSAPVPATAPAPAPASTSVPPAVATEPPKPPQPVPAPAAPRAAVVESLDARLCQALDVQANWRCDPLPESAIIGPVFFVTRLKSATDTSIEHRWYRNNRLSQSVTLRVKATGGGYRTYSRMTVGQDRPGTWRVEVRSPGGAVLDQKTFVVGPS